MVEPTVSPTYCRRDLMSFPPNCRSDQCRLDGPRPARVLEMLLSWNWKSLRGTRMGRIAIILSAASFRVVVDLPIIIMVTCGICMLMHVNAWTLFRTHGILRYICMYCTY